MIPRLKPRLGSAEILAALSPPSANDVKHFESLFAQTMDTRFAVAFPYGRTALVILLEALGVKNAEVLIPAYTCVVVNHAVAYSGNTAVSIDSQEFDFNADLSLLPKLITEKTGAIIPTSLFGYPCNLDQLDAFKSPAYKEIFIIQDCAHSFGATWKNRPVHKEGIAAYYGLNISKILTSIFGGMITTDDENLYEKLKYLQKTRLSPPTWLKSIQRLFYLGAVYPTFWEPAFTFINWLERKRLLDRFTYPINEEEIAMPSDYLVNLTPVEARVGMANLNRYNQIIADRRAMADYYFNHLQIEDFILPPRVEGATYSHFVVQVSDRKDWVARCKKRGLQLGELIDYSIPELKAYGANPPEAHPVSAKFARNTINIPIWGDLKLAERIVDILHDVDRERRS